MRTALVGLAVVCLGLTAPLRAHRLDEYLQAARVAISADRVSVDLDLTAGVAIAPSVLAMIDTDGNGEISAAEGDAYARRVIDGLVMTVDGRPVRPQLDRRQMPDRRDVKEGTGMIRLSASAPLPVLQEGSHQLFLGNTHRSDIGVYLANALVPTDRRIEITGQRRDVAQHELTIDYALAHATDGPVVRGWQATAGIVIAVLLGGLLLKKTRTAF
jgi:nickel/cobalt transporter (NicO) family protein